MQNAETVTVDESLATPENDSGLSKQTRYLQLLLLTIAGGAIYPMLYMRQIYQTTMLEAFSITDAQLGELYSMMGLLFFLTYAVSGWLADRIKPMKLIIVSLMGTGLLGLWYSTLPSFTSLIIIFGGWGCTTGLTFWGAVMKRIKILAGNTESGRFYGLYDGGRGLVEALLASIALYIFSQVAGTDNKDVVSALVSVIYMYSFFCIVLSILCIFPAVQEHRQTIDLKDAEKEKNKSENLFQDIIWLLKIPETWLIALIISAGYHLFWATYSFSAYLQEGGWGFTAVMAGTITTIKLWLRPLGGGGGGYLGDKYSNTRVLNWSLVISVLALLGLIFVPLLKLDQSVIVGFCIGFILLAGLMTYAIRGLYWSIIKHLDVPVTKLGLAIGIISTIGYSPDIFIPLINGYCIQYAKDHGLGLQTGYQMYFGYTVAMTVVGIVCCYILQKRAQKAEEEKQIS